MDSGGDRVMALNEVTGFPTRACTPTKSLLARNRRSSGQAGRHHGLVRTGWQPKIRIQVEPQASSNSSRRAILGYPASWPAGPWIVPLFWLTAVTLALLMWSFV